MLLVYVFDVCGRRERDVLAEDADRQTHVGLKSVLHQSNAPSAVEAAEEIRLYVRARIFFRLM